jgi:hypothetical protein
VSNLQTRSYFLLAGLAWPALLLALLWLSPGPDSQRGLAREIWGPQAISTQPPRPSANSVAPLTGRDGGVRVFWDERQPGKFTGVIEIPAEELRGNSGAAPPEPGSKPAQHPPDAPGAGS